MVFLSGDFSRVSPAIAQEICRTARLSPNARPRNVHGEDAEALYKAIQTTKIMAPPSSCISPIGEKAILHGLYKQIKGDFYTAVTRPPSVYRSHPFAIEAGLAFGKGPDQEAVAVAPAAPLAEGEDCKEDSELARVIRYANRVPLLYQQSACATFKAVLDTAWRNYGVTESRGALPAGPMVIFVHMASVWVPFTSESKEAIADYDEIRKEIKLALQECGRRLGVFLRRRERAKSEFRRRNIFELYIEEVVDACARLKGGKLAKDKLRTQLQKIAARRTGGALEPTRSSGSDTGPEGLPHSIIVTPEGLEGEAPALAGVEPGSPGGEEPSPESHCLDADTQGRRATAPWPVRGGSSQAEDRRQQRFDGALPGPRTDQAGRKTAGSSDAPSTGPRRIRPGGRPPPAAARRPHGASTRGAAGGRSCAWATSGAARPLSCRAGAHPRPLGLPKTGKKKR